MRYFFVSYWAGFEKSIMETAFPCEGYPTRKQILKEIHDTGETERMSMVRLINVQAWTHEQFDAFVEEDYY